MRVCQNSMWSTSIAKYVHINGGDVNHARGFAYWGGNTMVMDAVRTQDVH